MLLRYHKYRYLDMFNLAFFSLSLAFLKFFKKFNAETLYTFSYSLVYDQLKDWEYIFNFFSYEKNSWKLLIKTNLN